MSAQTQEESDGSTISTVTDVLDGVRIPSSLLIAASGVVLILIGYLMQDGVWAGIIPIWGIALILMGLVGYAYVWWTYRG